MSFDVDDDKILEYDSALIDINPDELTKDATVEAIIEKYNAELEKIMKVEIGSASEVIERGSGNAESGMGNLLTDAMRQACGADVALTNSGGIRSDINKGKITVGDVFGALPHDNTIVTMKLKGSELINVLNEGVVKKPRILQVSGLTLKVADDGKPDVYINGEKLGGETVYTVAANSHIAAGKGGYSIFNNFKNKTDTKIKQRDCLFVT